MKTGVLVAAVVALILLRLMHRHELSVGLLVVVPLVLGYFGVDNLRSPYDAALIALLAGCIVTELALGAWLGRTYRMWRDADGKVWAQGTKLTLILWLVAFAVRFLFTAVGEATSELDSESAEILLSIAATFVGQNLVMAQRAGLISRLLQREEPPAGSQPL